MWSKVLETYGPDIGRESSDSYNSELSTNRTKKNSRLKMFFKRIFSKKHE